MPTRCWPTAPTSSTSARPRPIPMPQPVPPEIEIARLAAVVPALKDKGAVALHRQLSRPRCSAGRWRRGWIISTTFTAFPTPRFIPTLAASDAKLIVMHMVQERGIAVRTDVPPAEIFDRVTGFLRCAHGGADRRRHRPRAADPGPRHGPVPRHRSGEFPDRAAPPAGAEGRASACRCWSRCRASASCASWSTGRPLEAGAASLAAELFAAAKGADYIRTHAPGALAGWP